MKRKIGIALVVLIVCVTYSYITYEAFFNPVYMDMMQALWGFYTLGLVGILFSWLFDMGVFTKND